MFRLFYWPALIRVRVRLCARLVRVRARGTSGTRAFSKRLQALICSIPCSIVEHLEQERGSLAPVYLLGLILAAMSAALAPCPNKLGVGYPAQRVFGGRGSRSWGEFAPGGIRLAGRWRSILAGWRASIGQAGSAISLPASIPGFQALSAAQLGTVAPAAVAPFGKAKRFHALAGLGRMIASLRTGARCAADPARQGAAGAAADRGGCPPFPRALAPYAPSGRQLSNLAISAQDGRSPSPIGAGCAGAALAGVANISHGHLGSGVRGSRDSATSEVRAGRIHRTCGAGCGVARGHVSLDLGRNCEAAGARV